MKMSIGDIADRYSICKLKKERIEFENEKELFELEEEIKKYDGIQFFVDKLYETNGQIWDLESDIRKSNEDILGLEEVGRRAIRIREINNIRVDLKNQINSKYSEGYIDIKMNHGSEREVSLVISLTTVPERLSLNSEDGLMNVLKHLCEQEDDDYEVHINIPYFSFSTKKEYIIPEWMNYYKLKYRHLKVFRTEDFGPPTKFVPTVQRITNPEVIILTVDDDLLYYPDMVTEHRKYHSILKDSIICYEGRGCYTPIHNWDLRDHWIICVTEIRKVKSFQHYKSASYKRGLFTEIFFKFYLGRTFSDDVLISRYFHDNNYDMYVVPYEKHNYMFETKELWDKNQGVTSFPIYRCATSVPDTGCNHPEILKLQPKFYEPNDLGKNIDNPNLIDISKYSTDKITHGYYPFYEKHFSDKLDCRHVMEIGVYNGDSLKLFSDYFKDAKIYGIDLNYINNIDSDKIKTFIANQSDKIQLGKILDELSCELDIVIDDGSHIMKDQQTSFGFLFKHLKSGGIYIIEDLHTSHPDLFPYHKSSDDLITTIEMLKTFISDKKIISNYIESEDIEYLENNIESIDIWSRTEDYSESVTSVIKKK